MSNELKNKQILLRYIAEIDRVIQEIATSGTSSASLSAGGGSKSYTRLDIDQLTKLRKTYASRVSAINRMLAGSSPAGIRRVMVTRC